MYMQRTQIWSVCIPLLSQTVYLSVVRGLDITSLCRHQVNEPISGNECEHPSAQLNKKCWRPVSDGQPVLETHAGHFHRSPTDCHHSKDLQHTPSGQINWLWYLNVTQSWNDSNYEAHLKSPLNQVDVILILKCKIKFRHLILIFVLFFIKSCFINISYCGPFTYSWQNTSSVSLFLFISEWFFF